MSSSILSYGMWGPVTLSYRECGERRADPIVEISIRRRDHTVTVDELRRSKIERRCERACPSDRSEGVDVNERDLAIEARASI